jgi:hypothetical protein
MLELQKAKYSKNVISESKNRKFGFKNIVWLPMGYFPCQNFACKHSE